MPLVLPPDLPVVTSAPGVSGDGPAVYAQPNMMRVDFDEATAARRETE